MKKIKLLLACTIIISMFSCNSSTKKTDSENKEIEKNEPVKVELNTKEQKDLNLFFSNFAEVNLASFTQEKGIGDAELIRFAVMHNYINNNKRFVSVGENNSEIKKDFIDESAKKYFGKSVSNHQSVDGAEYGNGFYTVPDAGGEAYTFAQVVNFSDLGDADYKAELKVYTAGSGWTGDANADPSKWSQDDAPALSYKVNAVVTKTENNKYILKEYVRTK